MLLLVKLVALVVLIIVVASNCCFLFGVLFVLIRLLFFHGLIVPSLCHFMSILIPF